MEYTLNIFYTYLIFSAFYQLLFIVLSSPVYLGYYIDKLIGTPLFNMCRIPFLEILKIVGAFQIILTIMFLISIPIINYK